MIEAAYETEGTFQLTFIGGMPFSLGEEVTSPVYDDFTKVEFVGRGWVKAYDAACLWDTPTIYTVTIMHRWPSESEGEDD